MTGPVLTTHVNDFGPQWAVTLDARSGPTATYRLEDHAASGLEYVGIHVSACDLLSCPEGILPLRDGVGVFVVSGADPAAFLPPTVTVGWLIRRTGLTASWTGQLP